MNKFVCVIVCDNKVFTSTQRAYYVSFGFSLNRMNHFLAFPPHLSLSLSAIKKDSDAITATTTASDANADATTTAIAAAAAASFVQCSPPPSTTGR